MRTLGLFVCALWVGCAQRAAPAPPFVSTSYPVGAFPVEIAVGDFNRDGIRDIAVANWSSASVSALMGRGDGTFTDSIEIPLGGKNPWSVVAADFDGDGFDDVLATDKSGATSTEGKTLSLLRGSPSGLTPPIDISTSPYPATLAVGDFNGDGHLDVAVEHFNQVGIELGGGDGSFQSAANVTPPAEIWDVASGDLNGDGNLDVVIAEGVTDQATDTGCVGVMLGRGDGTLSDPVAFPAGIVAGSVAIGDLNGDGRLDVVAANQAVSPGAATVLLGQGDGALAPMKSFDAGGRVAWDVAIADFDNDGKNDVLLSIMADGEVVILRGDGQGGLSSPTTYPASYGARGVAAADFDGDHRVDFAVAVAQGGNVTVFMNRGEAH